MKRTNLLAYYLEDLWSKGFKLSDEEVRFIYFGRNSTNAMDVQAIIALKFTLQIKYRFDGSFYLSLLELFTKEWITVDKRAIQILSQKGIL